jgi:beta-glucosidase
MVITFPDDFIFGTSTAATQIESSFDHDWQGTLARDGFVFDRTTDHELRWKEDATIIASVAPGYRMSLMWSKLQRAPFAKLDPHTVQEYHFFLEDLKTKNISIMMVLHHFTNPKWFARAGGWENEKNILVWKDFVQQFVDEFGKYVSFWNTFNEPNVYVSNGWLMRQFPPFKFNPLLAIKVVKNLSEAHNIAYDCIKSRFPNHQIGISHNAAIFSQENILGWLPAQLSDWWFMDFIPSYFTKVDFFGMSYYGRISHDPMPITYMDTPHKINKLQKKHDEMWEYHPVGLGMCLDRYWKKYRKPIFITENGVCDQTDFLRMQAIQDYAHIVSQAIKDGIEVKGYYWWSTWDNFEWHLGPTKRFGLYECDLETKERRMRPSAELYRQLAYHKKLRVA